MLSAVAACLGVAGIYFVVSSAVQGIPPRKGRLRLQAYLCIAGCIYGIATAVLVYEAKLPVFEFSGTIEQAQMQTEGRSHRTTLLVRISGGEITVNASGTSPFFHAGQSLRARYQGVTGHILQAHFLSADGADVGVFNGTDTWFPYWLILGGSFVIFAGQKKYRRDPEGAERA